MKHRLTPTIGNRPTGDDMIIKNQAAIIERQNEEIKNYEEGKIFKNLNEDSEVKAILITGISVDWYEYLYKKAKNKEPEYVINNYKKYSKNTEDKFWFLGDI